MIKYLISLIFIISACDLAAQPLNPRWFGTWKSNETELIIDGSTFFRVQRSASPPVTTQCRWVDQEPQRPFAGCVALYRGAVSKTDILNMLNKGIFDAQTSRDSGSFARLQQTKMAIANPLSNENFRVVSVTDWDTLKNGSQESWQAYFLDGANIYYFYNHYFAPTAFNLERLSRTAGQPVQQQPTSIQILDGHWYSPEWKYGYQLRNGLGIATSSNSIKFKPGDPIIELIPIGSNQFQGKQIYTDGNFYNVRATFLPDGRLYFEGEKNVKWYMNRTR
jgi:hypothetical protein